jgi:hypothetical protein
MPSPLRLQAVALPVSDLGAADPFYRWTFRLELAPETSPAGTLALGWGREDRVLLVGPEAGDGASLTLRMPSMTPEEALAWCAERALEPSAVAGPRADVDLAAERLTGVAIQAVEDPRLLNVFRLTVRGWGSAHVELAFAIPGTVLARRGQTGPFLWRGEDWQGLETPGLLGVTLAGPDVEAGRAFWRRIGARPLDEAADPSGPLRVGDHQVVLAEREPAGLRGVALLVSEAKLGEVARTLSHLKVEFRQAGNRVLARDPDGRVVFVQGVRAA